MSTNERQFHEKALRYFGLIILFHPISQVIFTSLRKRKALTWISLKHMYNSLVDDGWLHS